MHSPRGCRTAQAYTSLGALIEQLEFPQGEWGLLKYCLTTKNLHLGKLLGLEQLKLPISTHGAALMAVVSRIIGHTLPDLEWRQAKLPANRGGLVLSDVLIIADAALISSHAASAKILIQTPE
jgi:hypothetical protein